MAKNVTYINFNGTTAKDRDLIRLLNLVADAEHRSPHNLAKHVLLDYLTARSKELDIDTASIQSARPAVGTRPAVDSRPQDTDAAKIAG